MRLRCLIAAVVLFPGCVVLAEPLGPGEHSREITVDERQRSYLVHVPASYDAEKPMPVVLAFHGAGMNAQMMVSYSQLSVSAEQHGFIAVYLNGIGVGPMLAFNAGGFVGGAGREWADDVAFTGAVLDELATLVTMDDRRVFATGMSNGGMMVYRLAAELSDRIAAIAPVAGTMAIADPQPSRAVPVIHFHGRDDSIVPWSGPSTRTPRFVRFLSVEECIEQWVKLNGCEPEADRQEIESAVEDGTSVRRWVYAGGTDGAEVVLYEIVGGGHTWPGVRPPLNIGGRSTMRISANDLMWAFFTRHPLPELVEE